MAESNSLILAAELPAILLQTLMTSTAQAMMTAMAAIEGRNAKHKRPKKFKALF